MLACSAFIAYGKTKTQISCAVTAQLISAFVFATYIVQSLFYLNPIYGPSTASRLGIVKQSLRDRQFSSDVTEHVSKA